jgi:aspartyl-tRNA(Asn)/glutamyl-tRNA(Gln) amidotransferase subunit A
MNETELTSLGLVEAAELIRQRAISPVELTQACLKRIERLDGKLISFITVNAEQALEQARQAEQELMRSPAEASQAVGVLHGVPLALKDLFETEGVRTTAGSLFYAKYIPSEDAAVVRKLRQAGALVLGKTNMHEIALGLTNVNPHYGACRNPWGLERVAGGSSGGSAAALAARFCPGALGTDTGGSIRVPAALCGVVGLKPTFGRISLRGVIPLSWNLDHVGPMARRVRDVALLLQVMAGYDAREPNSVDIPADDYSAQLNKGIKGWHIALAEDEYFAATEEAVQQAVNQAAAVLQKCGAHVERVAFPGAHQAALANGMTVTADAATLHAERLRTQPGKFGSDVLQRLKTGAALPLTDYVQARRIQTQMRRQFAEFFEVYDILLMPTTPVVAPPIEGPNAVELARLLTRYTAPFNLTGLPAISVPCGFTAQGLPVGGPLGLPIGLQMVAKPWAEAQLLRAAYTYEQASDWQAAEPAL